MTDHQTLPFTGERFTPECSKGIWYEHWHRYVFASTLVRGKDVLDAACGEGYGSAFLARLAKSVSGIDVSDETIAHARARYDGIKGLSFTAGSVVSIPLSDKSVDVVVSFETIEHLTGQAEMLREFRRVLRTGGLLILSSPNRRVYSDEPGYRNEFHVRELYRDELHQLVAAVFPRSQWYGQRLLFNSVIWPQKSAYSSGTAQFASLSDGNAVLLDEPSEAMYFLLICGDTESNLPDRAPLSLFADREQSVLREYESLMREQEEWKDKIARGDAELTDLHERVEVATRERDALRIETDAASRKQVVLSKQVAELQDQTSRVASSLRQIDSRLRFRESWVGWLRFPFSRLRVLFSKLGKGV